MSRSRFGSLILLTLFLVQLFAGFGEAGGLVWCFGAGGEVRLENIPQGRCDVAVPCADEKGGEDHAEGEGRRAPDLEHCGDCLDLPALSASFRHSPRFSPEADLFPAPLPAPPAPVLSAVLLPEEVPGFLPHPPPPLPPFLIALRTVVLRN